MAAVVNSVHDEAVVPADSGSRRRLDVQGLRAVAVIIVILDHVGFRVFGGGFVGVDVFFVISGYVITRMLIRSCDRQGAGWFLDFYARRARRIVPAATLITVLTVVATFEFTSFLRGAAVLPDATAAALFVANLHFMATGTDYASLGADPSPMQHYWSLAVEEQFYFVWPLLVVLSLALVTRFTRLTLRQVLAVGLIAVIAVSYAHGIVATAANGTTAFFSPLTRAWELGLGCLVAVAEPSLAKRLPALGALLSGWLGIAAIAWSVLVLDHATPFPGAIAAVPVLGTAAVILAGMSPSRASVSTLLSTRAARYVGDISYSLYLVHWPVFTIVAARTGGDHSLAVQFALIGASVIGAAAMYHAFEDPIRRSRFLAARPWASLAIVPVAIGIVFAVALFERYRWALDTPVLAQLF